MQGQVDTQRAHVMSAVGTTSGLMRVPFAGPSAAAAPHLALVVLVPSDPLDVVPCVGLMAEIALLHARMRLSGYSCRDHFEMPHMIVAWRCLMALCAVLGLRRRMPVPGDLPGRRRMAVGALAPE